MPAAIAADAGQRPSDCDLGNRHGATCGAEVVALVGDVLRGFGYRITKSRH